MNEKEKENLDHSKENEILITDVDLINERKHKKEDHKSARQVNS